MKFQAILLLSLAVVLSSGTCDRKDEPAGQKKQKARKEKVLRILQPANETSFIPGEEIKISLGIADTVSVDSIQVFIKGNLVRTINSDSLIIDSKGMNPGKVGLRVKLFYNSGSTDSDSNQLEILSDIVPRRYTYKVINTYPHDISAYTQGLEYYDGWLYEGTGNYNQSTLRKVRLENGEVIQVRNNSSDIFGEGITILNGKIFQLTYKAQICYVYDLNSFNEIKKFYYPNKEGWGLTNNGEELIMSDGSHILYFIDPEMFTINRQVEVYNNEGPVDSLNELEYINGKVYANRYYTDEIVIIDPLSGKEEGRVDMKGILPVKDRKPTTNVLNGIAWDGSAYRLFVTGKYWPKLFEIDLVSLGE